MNIGTHKAKVIAKQWSETKSGEGYISIRFARVDAPDQTILWSGFLGGKVDAGGKTQQFRTEEAMKATGWNGDYGDLSSVGSKECEIVVQENVYQGKTEIQCRYVQPLGTAASFMPKALDPDKVKRLAARMTKRAKPDTDEDAPF
jgi:hypothetical protein